MADAIHPGDYVRPAWDPEGAICQVIRVKGATAYLRPVLARADVRHEALCPVSQLLPVSPRETARALVEAWLTSDFFSMD